jgi:HopA1 effector protein family
MKTITQQLNAIAIPFTFKVPYNPSDYDRYDSGILKCDRNNYESVRQILETVYQENKDYFQQSVPLFTKFLAPGLSLAEAPKDKEIEPTSFGKNRCQIVADGLLEAWQKDDDSPENRRRSIRKHFSGHGIELDRPYLNTNSEDIYNFAKER